jgi:hypothetical protein
MTWTANAIRAAVAVLAIVAVLAMLFAIRSCNSARDAGAAAKIERGRGEAAIDSGRDAVETIGNAAARETQIHDSVKDGTDAINDAPAGDSNDAADRAACRLRAYHDHPRCRALLEPGAK